MSGAPQDHFLIAWAVCCGGGRWEPWAGQWLGAYRYREPYGQFNFDGDVFLTRLSKMGVPIVTRRMRETILARFAEFKMDG